MIAREWRCICPADKIDEFIPYLHETGVKDAGNTPGFKGAEILQRETVSVKFPPLISGDINLISRKVTRKESF